VLHILSYHDSPLIRLIIFGKELYSRVFLRAFTCNLLLLVRGLALLGFSLIFLG
jgi:hypothetical protein